MPELLEGRTTDPATWLRTQENLNRLAALIREADTRRRAITNRQQPEQTTAAAARPDGQRQHNAPQPDQGRGAGRDWA